MSRRLRWVPALWDGHRPAPAGAIKAAEAAIGVTFPEDYRAIVTEHHGEAPEPACFDFVAGTATDASVMGPLFHLLDTAAGGELAGYGLVAKAGRQWLPEGVVPISEDPAGNPIALDFRADRAAAQGLVFVEHESDGDEVAVWPLAQSLAAFLETLHD